MCFVNLSSSASLEDRGSLQAELDRLVSRDRIVLFMKGNRKFPISGLSSDLCFMLKQCNLEFSTVDLLIRPSLSLFMRTLHAPISAPYLYVEGRFIGGHETVSTMFNSGLLSSIILSDSKGK